MKKILIQVLTLTLCLSIITGCSPADTETVSYIEEHFQTNKNVEYLEPEVNLEKDHAFTFEISSDIKRKIRKDGYSTNAIFSVYADAELTQPIEGDNRWKKDNTYTISPSETPASFKYNAKNHILSANHEWGIYNHYYLVQSFDLETGKKLKKPLVTVFTIAHSLETPDINIVKKKDNSLSINWDPIENADEYFLVRVDFQRDGKNILVPISCTKNTTWNSSKDGKDMEDVEANVFKSYSISEDSQYTLDVKNWWENDTVFSLGSTFGVIAHEGDNYSSLSYLDTKSFDRDTTVCQAAPYALKEINFTGKLENIEQIPYQLPSTLCTGNTLNSAVEIDVKKAKIESDGLHVPYTLKNSYIDGSFVISSYEKDSYLQELKDKVAKNKIEYEEQDEYEYVYQNKKVIAFNVKRSNTLPEIEDNIYSTSELETFITSNMIDGAAMIDISDFDYEGDIYDLLSQAILQNPLVLEVLDYYYDYDEKIIYLHYLYDNVARSHIQQTIRDEVKRISGEICTPEMSDVEKIYAINQYICDTTVYNDAAAESNDYRLHDDYAYANTAEGVFVQHNAVCEGYAAAFMLLADAVDIDSLMITGYPTAEGSRRHAWNRVLVDDKWYVVDPTHNDMEHTPNSVLLLGDESANKLYKEDEYWILDEDLDTFKAPGDDIYEYYRSKNLSVSNAEAASTLTKLLRNSNSATIRVPIDTTESQYDAIGQSVADALHTGVTYYYISGVITMYKE